MAAAAAFIAVLAASDIPAADGTPLEPGPAIDYRPLAFYPDRWSEYGVEPRLFPWSGRVIVLLTPVPDLDGGTMKIFLDRLDRGWEHYAATVGVEPARRNAIGDKPTIAAVPDPRLSCGMGCGRIGATGIEVAGLGVDWEYHMAKPPLN